MKKLTLLFLVSLTGCGETLRTQLVSPEVPKETRTPCEISERKAQTYRDLAILATEHLSSAQCANGKIETIDNILKEAENANRK